MSSLGPQHRRSSPQLQSMPIDVLIKIIEYADELRYTSRHFHMVAEKLDSHRLLKHISTYFERGLLYRIIENKVTSSYLSQFSYSANTDEHDNQTHTPRLSSKILLAFLNRDYCFFTPDNIVTGSPDTEIEHLHLDEDGNGPSVMDLSYGTWKHITGGLYSSAHTCLHASNVHWLNLQYRTRLAPGRYDVHIQIGAMDLPNLMPVRFKVSGSGYARQIFSQFCPSSFSLGKTDTFTPYYINLGEIIVLDPGRAYPHQLEGVFNDNGVPGLWPEIRVQIEDVGSSCQRKIQFAHMSFIKKPEISAKSPEWLTTTVPASPTINPELRVAYEEYTKIKTDLLSQNWKTPFPFEDDSVVAHTDFSISLDQFYMPAHLDANAETSEAQTVRSESKVLRALINEHG